MLGPNVRKLLITFVGGAIVAGVACGTNVQRTIPQGGTAGATGSAGATGTAGATSGSAGAGTAGATTGGTAGATGTAGLTGGSAGAGTAGATTGGTAGASGTAGATGGTAGSVGGTAGATTGGTAGATVVDNTPILPLPVAVTANWYPSGWDGDANTVAAFTAVPPPITITDMSTATTGPCAHRVAGALGSCFKITYTPIAQPDGGAPGNASVALLANLPGGATPNFNDNTMTPRVAPGAMRAAVQVAGDVGGESVLFNLGSGTDSGYFDMQFTGITLTTSWQQLTTAIQPGYSHIFSPFGWGSSSATPITFYYDDVRIDATAP
jgi:hypothetical protein